MGLRRALANPDIHWVGLHSAKALSTCVFPWFFGLNEKLTTVRGFTSSE